MMNDCFKIACFTWPHSQKSTSTHSLLDKKTRIRNIIIVRRLPATFSLLWNGLTGHHSQAQSDTSSDEMSQLFQWNQASAKAQMDQGCLWYSPLSFGKKASTAGHCFMLFHVIWYWQSCWFLIGYVLQLWLVFWFSFLIEGFWSTLAFPHILQTLSPHCYATHMLDTCKCFLQKCFLMYDRKV